MVLTLDTVLYPSDLLSTLQYHSQRLDFIFQLLFRPLVAAKKCHLDNTT